MNTTAEDTIPSIDETPTVKTEPAIIASIRQEQKYTLMLLSVLHEQLAEFDIGKTPDYAVMLEVMTHTSQLPERFNHVLKAEFIQKIIDKNPEGHIPLENLLAEQANVIELAKDVIKLLKGLLKEQTILREEQLKIFSKNYVELLESHIEIENSYLLETELPLSEDDLDDYSKKLQRAEDPKLVAIVEERYKELSEHLNLSLDDLEEAATDFAFSEFLSISALFDAIEPLSIGIYEISKILKEYSAERYMANYQCYKELITQKQDDKQNYINKPKECLIDGYHRYTESLNKIKDVVSKTRVQVVEPYKAHKEKFKTYHAPKR